MPLKTSHCPWSVEIEGDDLVVHDILATCFGGGHDSGDDGQTENGILNNGRDPHLLGVALPIRSVEPATALSPLAFKGPHIPWNTPVKVWREAEGEATAITCRLIDNGPNVQKYPSHALDLTVAAAQHFAAGFPAARLANDWSGSGLSYRIVGAAKYAGGVA
jgi:hypothetical protein